MPQKLRPPGIDWPPYRLPLTAYRKGARAPLRLLAPFVMHQSDRHSADREDLTPAAQAVLREGAPIAELFAKVP